MPDVPGGCEWPNRISVFPLFPRFAAAGAGRLTRGRCVDQRGWRSAPCFDCAGDRAPESKQDGTGRYFVMFPTKRERRAV